MVASSGFGSRLATNRCPAARSLKSIAESAGGVSDAIPFFGGATALSVRGIAYPATGDTRDREVAGDLRSPS